MLTKEQIEAIAAKLLAFYDVTFNVRINLEDPRDIPAEIFIRCADSRVCVMNFFSRDLINGEEIFELAFGYRLGELHYLLVKEVCDAK